MHSAQTLDAKIGALTAAVGDLQGEVQAALATLRAAGNVAGTLSYLSRVTLLLMRRLFGAAGQQAPSDNLNAMQWCREAQRHEWQGRLALEIGRFLLRRGSLDEALRSLEWGLEAAQQVPEEATRLYAQLLLEGAGLHLDTHEWAAARARALDALALFETSGDIVGQADTQNLLGLAARGARDYPEASRYFAQAYTAYERAAGQAGETGVANALNNLGITEDEAGCKQVVSANGGGLASRHRAHTARPRAVRTVDAPLSTHGARCRPRDTHHPRRVTTTIACTLSSMRSEETLPMFRELSCLAVMIPLGAVCMGIVFGPAMAMAQPTPMPATSDEARMRQVADQFFAAYPKQDLDGLMALWSQQSPDYARRRQAMQDFFAASRDMQLKSLAFISVTVEGNTARVQVEVEIALTDMTSGQPSPRVGQLQRVLYLVREDDMWKV